MSRGVLNSSLSLPAHVHFANYKSNYMTYTLHAYKNQSAQFAGTFTSLFFHPLFSSRIAFSSCCVLCYVLCFRCILYSLYYCPSTCALLLWLYKLLVVVFDLSPGARRTWQNLLQNDTRLFFFNFLILSTFCWFVFLWSYADLRISWSPWRVPGLRCYA